MFASIVGKVDILHVNAMNQERKNLKEIMTEIITEGIKEIVKNEEVEEALAIEVRETDSVTTVKGMDIWPETVRKREVLF